VWFVSVVGILFGIGIREGEVFVVVVGEVLLLDVGFGLIGVFFF